MIVYKRLFWLVTVSLLALAGCASAPQVPATVLVPTPIPCPAAQDVPEAPARTLSLDPAHPGAAVQAFTANRARWIGYADALRTKLEACR